MHIPSRIYWQNRRVIVTGGNGFLGSHVCDCLHELGARLFVPRSMRYDLRREDAVKRMYQDFPHADTVIHLAATVGGIGATSQNPAGSFYDNLSMGMHLIHHAHLARVEKFVCMGSVCAYPRNCPVPTSEQCLWDGYPEETNAPYGVAKRTLQAMLDAYHKQRGLKSVYILLANLYGPGDDFSDETSHVIPALIKKCLHAKRHGVEGISVWGTGRASRDFLYVKDAAQGVILAAEKLDSPEPINLASGQEVYIAGLVELVKEATGYEGMTAYDTTKPDGQPRRAFHIFRALRYLGWQARTDLRDGLRATVEWYQAHEKVAA